MKKTLPYQNRSPHGWWIASYIEQAVWNDKPHSALTDRCLAWENTIILKAANRNAAYKKVLKLTKIRPTFTDESGKRKGRWKFVGITNLLPIYEELEDGAEILWTEHRNVTIKKIRSLVKHKGELRVFKDGLRDAAKD